MLEIHLPLLPYEVLRDVNVTAAVDLFHARMWLMSNTYVPQLKGSGQRSSFFFFFSRRNRDDVEYVRKAGSVRAPALCFVLLNCLVDLKLRKPSSCCDG